MKAKTKVFPGLLLLTVMAFLVSCGDLGNKESVLDKTYEGDGEGLERVKQELVPAPGVPVYEQVASGDPKIIEVELIAQEVKKEIAPGDSVWAMTFNGTVPAPLIVGHEGDFVELTLKNPASNSQMHNIDFHAATGHEGGADITTVQPGEQVVMRFRLTRAGVFVYHCAPGGMMTPMHVVSGMNGIIMVLPREGLQDENGNSVSYDTAFYVMEQDFYLPKDENGNFLNIETPSESLKQMEEAMKTLQPTHIVFNGRKGSTIGRNALQTTVGKKVLLISGQANRDTRMHLIGGHADLYWPLGKFHNRPLVDLETWDIPGGSAAAALYKFREPGTYTYLNHNLIEAVAYGAVGQIKVEGEWDNALMQQIAKPGPVQE